METQIGIKLTGRGARGSYQAGALQAIFEIYIELKLGERGRLIDYWSGVSAGSINATFMAGGSQDYLQQSKALVDLWANIRCEDVFETGVASLAMNGLRWAKDLTIGAGSDAKSLLQTGPLYDFLKERLPLKAVQEAIQNKKIRGLLATAFNYSDNSSVTFHQSGQTVDWKKERRYSVAAEITTDHIMASCAIPLLFPTWQVGESHFGDGAFRNTHPLSPLIHLDVRKILVIGVRGATHRSARGAKGEPLVSKIAGNILNALFFDNFDLDYERLETTNEIVRAFDHQNVETTRSHYSVLDILYLKPSRDINKIAEEKMKSLPNMIRYMLGGLGPASESAELGSYILFEPEFSKALIEMGYEDTLAKKENVIRWFERPMP